jgi:platelet-activating factor acetylhydrolase IB subunit alpha
MLSNSQRVQLNKDILEYLVKNNLTATAEKLSEEIGVSLADLDPEGNKLEVKWKSILALQKKILNLEEQVKNLQEAAKGAPKKGPADPASEDSFLPVTPARLELKGHKANITALTFHPQYSSLASSSDDGTIKIWEFETGDL